MWGDEVVLSLLPWLGMTGMFLAIRRRQVIRIDYFASLLPRPVSAVLSVFSSVFAAAVFIWLAVVSTQYVGLFGGDRLLYLADRQGLFMSAMVIGPANCRTRLHRGLRSRTSVVRAATDRDFSGRRP